MDQSLANQARAILGAYKQKLDFVGHELRDQMRDRAINIGLRSSGDFVQRISYKVVEYPDRMCLYLGSDVKYEQYVLGGKVPSWTPIEPLLEWIKVRKITMYDGDKPMKPKQMAFLISRKHSRQGIEPRNIVTWVLDKGENWIFKQLNQVVVK